MAEDGTPKLIKLPELNFIDDKEGKPVGIHQYIGKRPVFAAGNSDGDYQMLQYTSTATGYPRFGQVAKGLDDAGKYDWLLVDMKNNWKEVFAGDLRKRKIN